MATRGEGDAGTRGSPAQGADASGSARGRQQTGGRAGVTEASGERTGGATQQAAGSAETERAIPVSGEGQRAQRREGARGRGGLVPARGGGGGLSALRGAIPLSPWELMMRMSEEMDRLLDSFGGAPQGRLARGQQNAAVPGANLRTSGGGALTPAMWVPQIDVVQRPDAVVVRAELSGVEPDDIDVTVENGVLTIAGERREEREEETQGLIHSERAYGSFMRSIPLPQDVDEDRIEANFRNGVLEIRVPVSERQRGRRIEVQSASGGGAGGAGGGARGGA